MLHTLHRISQRLETSIYVCLRQASTSIEPDKSYTATLLLPKTPFPIRADPSIREAPFRKRTTEKLYKWQWENATGGPLFVLHDGPPYANGSLHMGHALNKILKDIINRFHVLMGHRVHYIPGWDCHGLPIENKALKELGASHRSLPAAQIRTLARQTAHREISVQKAEFSKLGIMADWTSEDGTYRTMDHDYELRQLRIFKGLVENDLIYRYYRPVHYSPSSRSALAEAELIYVDNHTSPSVYVTYKCQLDGMSDDFRKVITPHSPDLTVNLLVWTTTPWTLPANMGIAVHSDLEYSIVKTKGTGKLFVVGRDRFRLLVNVLGDTTVLYNLKGYDLLRSRYTSIFQKAGSSLESLPVIHAPHVTSLSGTCLVHCAPAHGSDDYLAFLTQNLLSGVDKSADAVGDDLRCLVGPEGTFSAEAISNAGWLPENFGARLTGKQVLTDGSAEVIEILKESGTLVKVEKFKHRYPYDWKTNTPVIVTATSQWFVDLSHIKTVALEMLQTVQFFPDSNRKRLETFVRDRSEWCISRQRPWGVPIPALYNDASSEAVMTSDSIEYILQVLEQRGVDHWWTGPVDDFVSPRLKEEHGHVSWIKGEDTMDVWFDSGTSWTGLAKLLPQRNNDGGIISRTIADVCLEGSDQHRGWFQSLLLTAVGFSNKEPVVGSPEKQPNPMDDLSIRPYGALITHGFVLDQRGKKMSKSLGNVISPMTIVEGGKAEVAHGADALRLWAATVDYGRDSVIGPMVIQNTVESLRKIRNSTRFMLGNLPESCHLDTKKKPELGEMSLTDRYMMFELYQLEKTAKDAYASYRFPQVVTALDRFAKVTLSSFYLDITKDTLYADFVESPRRRSVIWVMDEVLHTMKMVLAPILPHLAEEIHDASHGRTGSSAESYPSVFVEGWRSVAEEWNDSNTDRDMKELLTVRGTVMTVLEKARIDKLIRSSLEAGVDIIVPGDLVSSNCTEPKLLELLREQESFLKTLFIVSEVSILDEGSLGVDAPEWSRSITMELEGYDEMINIRVRPSSGQKCPRCWNYSRTKEAVLCARCTQVLQ